MAEAPKRSTISLRTLAPYARAQPAALDPEPRELRRGDEVMRIYREDTCLVTHAGRHCRILEYPTEAAASRAHARAIARLVEQGFCEVPF